MSPSSPQKSCYSSRILHENPRLRVIEVQLSPSRTTPFSHANPTVRWRVAADGDVAAPRPVFYNAGEDAATPNQRYPNEHNSNNNQEPSREIVFEILQSRPQHTEEEVKRMLARAVYSTHIGGKMVLENEFCRLWDFQIPPGGGHRSNDLHQHVLPYAFVFLQHGRLRVYKPRLLREEKPGEEDDTELVCLMERQSGEVIWSSISNGGFEEDSEIKLSIPKAVHSVENDCTDSKFREYMIELK
mmetsp:Transcript_26835/g.53579  ORF Transcript_26835/g.53579 Transcript_26835/m.53579 type:complete len:243 (+) Transcript_26835:228-956(+)